MNASKNLIIHKGSARNNLNLVALDEEDFGNYNCLAENKLGMDTDSVRIAGMLIVAGHLLSDYQVFKDFPFI